MPLIDLKCAYCHKDIQIPTWRLTKAKYFCCNYKCSARHRSATHAAGEWTAHAQRATKDILADIEHAYRHDSSTVEDIAVRFGFSRSSIQQYARIHKWIRFKRVQSLRTQYRKAAMAALGRQLEKGEHVHHIDGDISNNSPNNLHVYETPKTHSQAHGSLERCAFELYKAGLIKFGKESGTYYLPGRQYRISTIAS